MTLPPHEKALAVEPSALSRRFPVQSKISGIVRRYVPRGGDDVTRRGALFSRSCPTDAAGTHRSPSGGGERPQQLRSGRKRRFDRQDSLKNRGSPPPRTSTPPRRICRRPRASWAWPGKGWPSSRRAGSRPPAKRRVDHPRAGRRHGARTSGHEGDPVVPLTTLPGRHAARRPWPTWATLLFKGTVDEIDVGKLRDGLAGADQDRCPSRRGGRAGGSPASRPRPRSRRAARCSTWRSTIVHRRWRGPARRLLGQRRHRDQGEDGRPAGPGAAGHASRATRPSSRCRAREGAEPTSGRSSMASPTDFRPRWSHGLAEGRRGGRAAARMRAPGE